MRLLLDTNIFLWIFLSRSRISVDVETLIRDAQNEIFLSAASAWEITIKYGINKLHLPDAPEIYVPDRMERGNFKRLEIKHEHALAVTNLPQIHKDPFDRLLVAQATVENLILLSSDSIFAQYSVKFIDSKTYKI